MDLHPIRPVKLGVNQSIEITLPVKGIRPVELGVNQSIEITLPVKGI